MQRVLFTDILLCINFFFLAMALSSIFIYAYRLKVVLKKSDQLRKTAEKYQRLFQAASEGVFRCTKEGKFLIINNGGARILGYDSSDELLDDNLTVSNFFTDPEDKKRLLKELKENREVNGFRVKMKSKNNECRFLEISVLIREEEGEDIFEGIFHDETHRIKLENELKEYHDHLEKLVNQRTKQLKTANKKISKHETELQTLSAQLIKTQEMERRKISHELHDDTGQALTAVKINLEFVKDELNSQHIPKIEERLIETLSLIDNVMDQIHELALNLRPTMLDDFGLMPTLRWFTNRFSNRINIDVNLNTEEMEERLSTEVETIIYRIVQEAMTNIAKHSVAQKVNIYLGIKKSKIILLIEDDGKGFDIKSILESKKNTERIGLLGIREKVISLKGHFNIRSKPGQGTQLSIEFPWEIPS